MNHVKMEFRTAVKLSRQRLRVSHHTPTLFLGSCFSRHIGNKTQKDYIPTLSNPTGIIYNPISLSQLISSSITKAQYNDKRVVSRGDMFCHLDHHGDMCAVDKEILQDQIESREKSIREFLSTTDFLFITWGTANVYRYKSDQLIAANCHKLPSSDFHRDLLSPKTIIDEWEKTLNELYQFRPGLNIIFTISPVRHIRDGLIENSRSKAHLLAAVHHLVDQYDRLHYFPAYEIIMDDLRDYRYYADDMVHPSQLGIRYVYEQFSRWCYDDATLRLITKIRTIQKAANHRPFHPTTSAHQTFLQSTLSQIDQLYQLHKIDMQLERQQLSAQLI